MHQFKLLLAILFIISLNVVYSQQAKISSQLDTQVSNKLHPHLRYLLTTDNLKRSKKDITTTELERFSELTKSFQNSLVISELESEPVIEIIAKVNDDAIDINFLEDVKKFKTTDNNYVTGKVKLSELENFAQEQNVIGIEPALRLFPELDNSIPAIKADSVWGGNVSYAISDSITGKNVFVGILDAKPDITHITFRDKSGNSRVKNTFNMDSGDAQYHGTHVAGIAAGRGDANGLYRGVAYDAWLLFGGYDLDNVTGYGNSNTALDSFQDMIDYVQGQPLVVNLSAGASEAHPHDGSTFFENIISDKITSNNVMLVKSAGNFRAKTHYHDSFSSLSDTLELSVALNNPPSSYDFFNNEFDVEIWTESGVELSIQVMGPDGTWSEWVEYGNTGQFILGNEVNNITTAIYLDGEMSYNSDNNDNLALIKFYCSGICDLIPIGDYKIKVALSNGSQLGEIDGYISRTLLISQISSSSRRYPSVTFSNGDIYQNITVPGYAENCMTVANHGHNYSSAGPSRIDTNPKTNPSKPDITAPGTNIISAIPSDDQFGDETGTSMAAPHVTGAIALLLQNFPDLSPSHIKTILKESANAHGSDARFWGAGDLNILEAYKYMVGYDKSFNFAYKSQFKDIFDKHDKGTIDKFTGLPIEPVQKNWNSITDVFVQDLTNGAIYYNRENSEAFWITENIWEIWSNNADTQATTGNPQSTTFLDTENNNYETVFFENGRMYWDETDVHYVPYPLTTNVPELVSIVPQNGTDTKTFEVTNNGVDPVDFNINNLATLKVLLKDKSDNVIAVESGDEILGPLYDTKMLTSAVDWLKITPTSGTINGGENIVITADFDAANLNPGIYSAVIKIFDVNYPDLNMVQMDVYFENQADSQFVNVSISNLNTAQFPPQIIMNVAVDTNGVSVDDLKKSNFAVYEDGIAQTDCFEVTPPSSSGGVRKADIVFLMDNSGSMGGEINAVSNNVTNFVDSLVQEGVDFGLGLTRYGASANSGSPIIVDNGILTTNADYFKNSIWSQNYTSGGTEPGYYAITQSLNSFSFRPGAQKIIIIITDETPNQGGASLEEALNACVQNSATLFALTSSRLFETFSPITNATNGAYYDIYSNFDPILNAIATQISANYVIRYCPDNQNTNAATRNVTVKVNFQNQDSYDYAQYTPSLPINLEQTSTTSEFSSKGWEAGSAFNIDIQISEASLNTKYGSSENVVSTIQSAKLFYKKTGVTGYSEVNMTNIKDEIWRGEIPSGFSAFPGVDYYITISNGEVNKSLPSEDPNLAPFQIAILPNEPPQISLDEVTTSTHGTPVEIKAIITDVSDSLQSVKLFYKNSLDIIYNEVDMIDVGSNVYVFQIPTDSLEINEEIDYYIVATDNYNLSKSIGTMDHPLMIDDNIAPIITNLPVVAFNEDENYTLKLDSCVCDQDNDLTELAFSANVLEARQLSFILNQYEKVKAKTKGNSEIQVSPSDLIITIDSSAQTAKFEASVDSTGEFDVELKVTDIKGASSIDTLLVRIIPVNDAPIVQQEISAITVAEDFNNFSIPIQDVFFDADGDELTYSLLHDNILTAQLGTNEIQIISNTDSNGTSTISLYASDGIEFVEEKIIINITPVNDAPVAFTLINPVNEDTTVAIENIEFEWETSSDVDNDSLNYSLVLFSTNWDTTISSITNTKFVYPNPLLENTLYNWYVEVTDGVEIIQSKDNFSFYTPKLTDMNDFLSGIPKEFSLYQNFPNPFNPSTIIRYGISKNSFVTLKVYNILGQEVVTLVKGIKAAGNYQVNFNVTNLSSGVYFYRINAKAQNDSENFIQVKKMVFVK